MKFKLSVFKGKKGKYFAGAAVGAFAATTLAFVNGCTQSDRSTGAREEVISQNASEAEAAEERLAMEQASASTKSEVKSAKSSAKSAHAKHEKKEKAASKVADNAKKSEQHGAVAKVATDTSVKRHPASVSGGVYVVQVGAFKVKENAEKLQEKLNSAGYHVEMQTMNHSRNGLLHLVRLTPTTNRAEAETMLEDLHAKHDMQAQIITMPASATH
jgi:DedD protein